jgi:hypothetical protein
MSTSAALALVATYRRTIHASLERIWENVLDWEHLPWLHRRSFLGIHLLEQTPTGWRARVKLPPAGTPREVVIEVQLDQPHLRYWSRAMEGQGAGSEILTCLHPVTERTTDIVVEFRVPQVSPAQAQALGAAYLRLYARLWDEDERMMIRRQALLDARLISKTPGVLRKEGKRSRARW